MQPWVYWMGIITGFVGLIHFPIGVVIAIRDLRSALKQLALGESPVFQGSQSASSLIRRIRNSFPALFGNFIFGINLITFNRRR